MQYLKSIFISPVLKFKTVRLLAIVTFTAIILPLTLYAGTPSKTPTGDDNWKIDTSGSKYIRLVVNGNVTWGDRLMFAFDKTNCTEAEVLMYFSSYEKTVVSFKDHKILLNFGNAEVSSKILSVYDFLLPHRIATIRVGFIEKDSLLRWEKLKDVISISISKNNPKLLQDAFDMKFNEYSTVGLTKALSRIEKVCEK